MSDLLVVPIESLPDEVVDVFFDKGWESWTRFVVKRTKGKVFLTKIGGRALSDIKFAFLCKELL